MFCQKLRSMIIWFWHQILSSSLCWDKSNIPMYALYINSKKYFSKSFFAFFLRFVFISIYYFNLAFCLNLIILCSFFKINPWFNACFKYLICIKYSLFSCKLAASYSNSLIFTLWHRKGEPWWRVHKISGYCWTLI